jgi:hypothetical protein
MVRPPGRSRSQACGCLRKGRADVAAGDKVIARSRALRARLARPCTALLLRLAAPGAGGGRVEHSSENAAGWSGS